MLNGKVHDNLPLFVTGSTAGVTLFGILGTAVCPDIAVAIFDADTVQAYPSIIRILWLMFAIFGACAGAASAFSVLRMRSVAAGAAAICTEDAVRPEELEELIRVHEELTAKINKLMKETTKETHKEKHK